MLRTDTIKHLSALHNESIWMMSQWKNIARSSISQSTFYLYISIQYILIHPSMYLLPPRQSHCWRGQSQLLSPSQYTTLVRPINTVSHRHVVIDTLMLAVDHNR